MSWDSRRQPLSAATHCLPASCHLRRPPPRTDYISPARPRLAILPSLRRKRSAMIFQQNLDAEIAVERGPSAADAGDAAARHEQRIQPVGQPVSAPEIEE